MILLPRDLRAALRENDALGRACEARGERFDPVPVLKLFNPLGSATWLATELDSDGDTLFGLADLGFGCPELGSFSLSEIAAIRLPFGLRIERDGAFATRLPLSVWAGWSHRAGSILRAEPILCRARPEDRGGG
ncbi:MAG: DUF2958 domain-containing protein [Novosphingobium sp.]|nr:DUF2958 domain-containing protein [Novosphingobium sp.]